MGCVMGDGGNTVAASFTGSERAFEGVTDFRS